MCHIQYVSSLYTRHTFSILLNLAFTPSPPSLLCPLPLTFCSSPSHISLSPSSLLLLIDYVIKDPSLRAII